MAINPIVSEAVVAMTAAIMASGVAAAFARGLQEYVLKRPRSIALKMRSGRWVELTLDRRLSQEQVSRAVVAKVALEEQVDQAASGASPDATTSRSVGAKIDAEPTTVKKERDVKSPPSKPQAAPPVPQKAPRRPHA